MTESKYQSEIETAERTLPSRLLTTKVMVSVSTVLFVLIIGLTLWFWLTPRPPVTPVKFELRLAETSPGDGLIKAVSSSGLTVYLHPTPVVTNVDVESVYPTYNYYDAEDVAVGIKLNTSGGHRMWSATAQHKGRPIALLIDGEVRGVPVVSTQVGGMVVLGGDFTEAEAEQIAAGIMAGR